MRKICRYLLEAALVAILLTQVTGCSVTLFGIAAINEKRSQEVKGNDYLKLSQLKPGKKIVVFDKAGDSTQGKFDDLYPLPDSIYLGKLINADSSGSIPIPNETLIVELTNDPLEVRGKFSGFNLYKKKFKYGSVPIPTLGPKVPIECRLLDGRIRNLPLNRISKMSSTSGKEYNPDLLRRLALEKTLPINSMLGVVNDSGLFQFAFDDIKLARVGERRGNKWKAGAVGLVFDIIMVLYFIENNPFELSFDGSN